MEHNYLFGITKKLLANYPEVKQCVVIDGSPAYHVTMGTPCITLSNPVDGESRPRYIIFPFPNCDGRSPRVIFDNFNESPITVKTVNAPNILDTTSKLDVYKLDKDNIRRSIAHAKEVGPITLMVDHTSGKELTLELLDMIKFLGKEFSLQALLHKDYYGTHGLSGKETIMFALTFINIKQCFPIYDSSKVDGVIVHGAAIYPEKSLLTDKLICSCEFTLAYSNFKENFTSIDGQKLALTLTTTESIKKVINSCQEYLGEIGKVTSNKIEKKSDEEMAPIQDLKYNINLSSTPMAYTTSTTSSHYIEIGDNNDGPF